MTPEQAALFEVVRTLERLGIPHMVTGSPVALASAEDTILSKLEWAKKAGRSEKQIADAAGVPTVNPALDHAYIDRWARELGVLDLWQEIAGEEPASD